VEKIRNLAEGGSLANTQKKSWEMIVMWIRMWMSILNPY